jgi:PIN domain nuclease of toxin-antitoxin system
MKPIILDASALLAFLFREPGAARVEESLTDSVMTTVNWGEMVGHFARHGASEAEIRRELDPCRLKE